MDTATSPTHSPHRSVEQVAGEPRAGPAASMGFDPRWSRWWFASTMIGLGVVGLAYGDFALVWQRIPIEHLPGRRSVAYACALVELLGGIGLLLKPVATIASLVLFAFVLLWLVLLKLPAVLMVPQMEATWLGFGEIAVIAAGAWILFAADAGPWERKHLKIVVGTRGIHWARRLFVVSLPMIGLSHFVYSAQTVAYVPHWLPFPLGWAYLTGAGSLAACLGLAFAVWPRLVAALEAAMLGVITVLVWGPGVFAVPPDRTAWTGFLISAAIAGGAWVVADSYRGMKWFAIGTPG